MDMVSLALKSVDDIQAESQMALDGMSLDQLMRRPSPQSNSMAWLAWHIARMQDVRAAVLAGGGQLWVSGGWHRRFGLPPDPDDHGRGHTSEQVDAVRPESAETLSDYSRAAHSSLRQELEKLAGAGELSAEVEGLIYSVIHGGFAHVGQLMYVRGLIEDRRWFPR